MGHGSGCRRDQGRDGGRSEGNRIPPQRQILAIEEEGVRFRSYVDGRERFLSPRGLDGGAGGARLGRRARVRRVHALPRRPRLHRALDGAHPPLARALPALARRARPARAARVRDRRRAACTRTCGAPPRARSRPAAATASRSAARSGDAKEQMYEVVGFAHAELGGEHESLPRHLLGIGEVDDLIEGVRARDRHVRLRDAHAPRPARERARRPDPARRAGGSTSSSGAGEESTSRRWRAAPAPRARRASRAPTCATSCAPASSPGVRLLTRTTSRSSRG